MLGCSKGKIAPSADGTEHGAGDSEAGPPVNCSL